MARYVIQDSNSHVFVIEETGNGNPITIDDTAFFDLVAYMETEGILDPLLSRVYFKTPDRTQILP